jgi:addiction module RelE/StbE family toxin
MVIWTKPAKEDLKLIHDFIAADSVFYANKVIEDIVFRTEQIEKFPNSGRIVPEISDTNTREIFIYSYRLMYEISEKNIYILTIVHGSRDFEQLLK